MVINGATSPRNSIEMRASTTDSSIPQNHFGSVSSCKDVTESQVTDLKEDPYMPVDESNPPPSFPPVDGGRQAWSFLLCATVLETLVWGELKELIRAMLRS